MSSEWCLVCAGQVWDNSCGHMPRPLGTRVLLAQLRATSTADEATRFRRAIGRQA